MKALLVEDDAILARQLVEAFSEAGFATDEATRPSGRVRRADRDGTPVAPVVDDLADVLRRIYRDRTVSISTAVAPDIVFAGERQDLEEMIGNLLDNACKWASAQVTVAASRDGPRLLLDIVDDGPGLDADEAYAALARGRRLDEGVDGYGLGLAIVEDLARLYGGHLDLDPGPAGLRARLVLPAALKP